MKWTCADCSAKKTHTQSNPCPACCGFTALDDSLRGEIGAAVIAMNADPLLALARTVSPELAESMDLLERVAEGSAS